MGKKTQFQQRFCMCYEQNNVTAYLTCDFKCVWLLGVDVDLPRSCLTVSIETNSPQVSHCPYGPQFTAGLIVALAHTWNLFECIIISHKYVSQ